MAISDREPFDGGSYADEQEGVDLGAELLDGETVDVSIIFNGGGLGAVADWLGTDLVGDVGRDPFGMAAIAND